MIFLKISNEIGRAWCKHHLACDCARLCQIWGHLNNARFINCPQVANWGWQTWSTHIVPHLWEWIVRERFFSSCLSFLMDTTWYKYAIIEGFKNFGQFWISYEFWKLWSNYGLTTLWIVYETFRWGPNGVLWSQCDVPSHHQVLQHDANSNFGTIDRCFNIM